MTDLLRRESRSAACVPFSAMPAQDVETPFEVEDPKQVFSDAAFEIAAAKQELRALGVDFFELPKASPKAEKTKAACMQVIGYLLGEPLLLQPVHKTACLPGKTLMQELGVTSKVLERHRKYILAGLVILGGDYPTLQGYLVTTEPVASRKYYDGSGALCVRIPDRQ